MSCYLPIFPLIHPSLYFWKKITCEGMYRNIVNCIKFNLNHLVTAYSYIDPSKIIKKRPATPSIDHSCLLAISHLKPFYFWQFANYCLPTLQNCVVCILYTFVWMKFFIIYSFFFLKATIFKCIHFFLQ